VNRARAALAGIATNIRASQAQLFSQEMNQKRSRFNVTLVNRAIDSNFYFHSISLLEQQRESFASLPDASAPYHPLSDHVRTAVFSSCLNT
jgi:hypothetical protein